MPTMTKLISAVFFAAVGYFAAQAFKPALPEGTQFGLFSEITAFIGMLCGWFVMGKLSGKGYYTSAGLGLRTSVTLTVWALLFFSIYLMIRKSMKMRYDGPMEALVDIFGLALEHAKLMLMPEFIGVLVIGGLLGGIAAEWAKRRWD